MAEESPPITDAARILLERSASEARRLGCATPGPAHILMAISNEPPTVASHVLGVIGIDVHVLRETIERTQSVHSVWSSLPPDFSEVMLQARVTAESFWCRSISTEHILLAALQMAGSAVLAAFKELNLSVDDVLARAQSLVGAMNRNAIVFPATRIESGCGGARHGVRRMMDQIWCELEETVAADMPRDEVLRRALIRVVQYLVAIGGAVWDVSDPTQPIAVAWLNLQPADYIDEAREVAMSRQRRWVKKVNAGLLFFQAVSVRRDLLMQVVQRPGTGKNWIRANQAVLERAGRLCESAGVGWT